MFPGSNNSGPSQTSSSHWTSHEDKLLKQAVEVVPIESPNWLEKIAELVPGKSLEDIEERCDALVQEFLKIESGPVEPPNYADDVAASPEGVCDSASENQSSSGCRSMSSKEVMMRKGATWTEEEHNQFLMGLEKHGKGAWKSISTNFVVTKTPTQVANHARRYFERQKPANNSGRKRASINDISTVDTNVVPPAVSQREDILCRNLANNVVAPANDQGSSSEGSNTTVEPPPYDFPDQTSGNGHGN